MTKTPWVLAGIAVLLCASANFGLAVGSAVGDETRSLVVALRKRPRRPVRAGFVQRIQTARRIVETVIADRRAWGINMSLPAGLREFLEQPDAEAARALELLERPRINDIANANARNRQIGEAFGRGEYRYPSATLFCHVTQHDGLLAILRSANLDVLFQPNGARDSETLGLLDLTRVGARPSRRLITRDVSEAAARGFGGVAILYDPDRFDASRLLPVNGTEYNDAWAYPVGLPNTTIAALQTLPDGPSALHLQSVKRQLASSGLYVPIVAWSGELLFSYSEFESIRKD